MKKDIITGDWLGIEFVDIITRQPIEDPLFVDICTLPGVTCPIKAGTAFSTTQKNTAPKVLHEPYAIVIAIGRGKPPEAEPIACSASLIGVSKSSAVSADLDIWGFL
ncbi:unnamed protein product [Rhizophagus irregularis]|nr:unnamed protein product [Rhizophagus irregularis]